MAPSKTFNVAGLYCSVAIIEDPELRARYNDYRTDLIPYVNITGYTAALAGYRDGQPWLEALLAYLESNRDFLTAYVKENLPGVRMVAPEGTYLAWLDCRGAHLPENPHKFFLREARVAVNDGATFGPGGEGFVRLNFGCPRALLVEGLERMRKALQGRAV
jgi:cystathionine beta-lyase